MKELVTIAEQIAAKTDRAATKHRRSRNPRPRADLGGAGSRCRRIRFFPWLIRGLYARRATHPDGHPGMSDEESVGSKSKAQLLANRIRQRFSSHLGPPLCRWRVLCGASDGITEKVTQAWPYLWEK